MNTESFQHLLELVTPLIKKKITPMRVPISPEEKLAAPLRLLASSESFQSLMHQFRISDKTISKFIPVVSVAICVARGVPEIIRFRRKMATDIEFDMGEVAVSKLYTRHGWETYRYKLTTELCFNILEL